MKDNFSVLLRLKQYILWSEGANFKNKILHFLNAWVKFLNAWRITSAQVTICQILCQFLNKSIPVQILYPSSIA